MPYKGEPRKYTTLSRPLFDWGLSLVCDPILAPKFNWHASRKYKHDGQSWERVIDEPDTADAWWEAEV